MTRNVPEHWIERLFSRMASIYGARFADMWRGADIDEVKATWRAGLADITDEGLKRGVAALFHEPHVPTLPRFRELCAPQPAMYTARASLVDDMHRTPSPEARAQLARIHSMAESIFSNRQSKRGGSILWAFRLLERAERGEAITVMQCGFAQEAIRLWCAAHGVPVVKTFDELEALGAAHPIAPEADELPMRRIDSPHIYGNDEREPGIDDEPIDYHAQGARP